MNAPSHRQRIVHVIGLVTCVAAALVVGSVSLHTLERWVAPVTAIVVSHVGALLLLVVLLRWRLRKASSQPDVHVS
jgi:hypothetical protein